MEEIRKCCNFILLKVFKAESHTVVGYLQSNIDHRNMVYLLAVRESDVREHYVFTYLEDSGNSFE